MIMKVSIYPTKEELRGALEAYLIENHAEFYESFTEVHWSAYYNENFYIRVSFLYYSCELIATEEGRMKS